ncbi:hypothetical protein CC79DRAFT_1338803 [Sarocladium strictum]
MTVQQDLPILSDHKLLDKIDRLRDLNISQHVALPQLVVVGDQSSGKSSLLESLTGIPFPRDQSLCTRHATQIRSRREDVESVKVSIVPGPHASEDHKKQVRGFQPAACSGTEFRAKFVEIMRQAHEVMGLQSQLSSATGNIFSQDVLTVDISGLNEDHLTIIDVPGIFRTAGEGTTKSDIDMINAMVRNYIKDERTIILAVLPSNVDVATQEILELAKEYDPNGERTIGVLTKPDLVEEASAQATVCDLVQGKKRPLSLGYYLVQNHWADSLQPAPEKTFSNSPWNKLPSDRVGVPGLKEQLQILLSEISRQEFPKLVADLNRKLKECNQELEGLGPTRQKPQEQRIYLSQIAGRFQETVRAALAADYNANPIFEQEELRLITQVINITDLFTFDFQWRAHTHNFGALKPPEGSQLAHTTDDSDNHSARTFRPALYKILAGKHLKVLEDAKLNEVTEQESVELSDIISLHKDIADPSGDVSAWISDAFRRSRGLDLGTFNAHIVSTTFAEQSRKWEPITTVYLSRVTITVHRFINAILSSVCSDSKTCRAVWDEILNGLITGYEKAFEQMQLLLHVNQRKQPWTLNARFNATLAKSRAESLTNLLYPQARKDSKQYGDTQHMVNIDNIPQAVKTQSNAEYLQDEIHHILRAYYNLALDRYIDNIFQLSVDYHLLNGPESPLKVFTQDWVLGLDPAKLEEIAGESTSTKRNRSRVKKKLADMEEALKVLRQT